MSKKIKMVLYGEPGVGKSVFASKAPKPFFICTDGNYEWLEEFGADPKAHVNVASWFEAKKQFNSKFDGYETIVIDLTEDLFKWCEYEFCARNKLEHISDLGYGKGYDSTRTEFFVELCKLIAMDKNIIFIMHGITYTIKDRRGVEHTHYAPTGRIPDKVIDMIEGRVRYFLRCYVKDEEQADGTVLKKRWLSIVPKPNEFGIIRGIDETKIPQDIPLSWNDFINTVGYTSDSTTYESIPTVSEQPVIEKLDTTPSEQTSSVESKPVDNKPVDVKPADSVSTETASVSNDTPPIATEEATPISNADKLAAIRAKLAKLKS